MLDGETGFVVDDEHAMAEAIGGSDEIDRERCRESARERFDVSAVAEAYERAYERRVEQPARRPTRPVATHFTHMLTCDPEGFTLPVRWRI